jgi:hypothetical protein
MNNRMSEESVSNLTCWQIAYIARDLRKQKTVTLSCHVGETDYLLEQINTFSSPAPVTSKMVGRPNSNEVFLELTNF